MKRLGMDSGLGLLTVAAVVSVGLSGCASPAAPEFRPDEPPVSAEAMRRGTPCYYRAAVEFCTDLKDSDGDGVMDDQDRCPATPRGVPVDAKGCPRDTDGDGVTDDKDLCPDTPRGVGVDEKGCPLDSDGDGVTDDKDQCPDTPRGAKVNEVGCWALTDLRFRFNRHELDPASYPVLNAVVRVMHDNPGLRIEIQGHTDPVGSLGYNEMLSKKRARSVMDYLVRQGVVAGRMVAVGLGWSQPVASNDTEEGRAKNRRVELKPVP
ncbi:MAG: OmpA family protein [Magnetococcales bacterium]|nr:OmpA family protein [Magnetococcales bacterium]